VDFHYEDRRRRVEYHLDTERCFETASHPIIQPQKRTRVIDVARDLRDDGIPATSPRSLGRLDLPRSISDIVTLDDIALGVDKLGSKAATRSACL
jgi:hypothetical protein